MCDQAPRDRVDTSPVARGAIPPRRTFLGLASGFFLALIGFRPRAAQAKKVGLPVAKVAELGTVGGSKALKIKDTEMLLVRDGETSIRAINDTCTHKKCKVKYKADSNDLFCKCHKSAFKLDGTVMAGPAPRPLTTYPAEITNGQIIITLPD